MHRSIPGPRSRRLESSFVLSILFVIALVGDPIDALARRGEPPLSPVGRGSIGEPTLRVDAPDVMLLKSEDDALRKDGVKTLRYAEPIDVSVTPDTEGRWETLAGGRRVWRMEIEGPGATDLNVGFTLFDVPYGAKLWVISTTADYYEGPYTHEDNKEHGELWVPVVPGDRAIVELQLPAVTKTEPRLLLTHVGYGYADVFNMNGLPKQGSCNNDVICPEGDPWRDQIKSVAVYSLGGSLFCSGQMVMDADSTFRPYFLTAYHCGLNATNAPSLTVFWNFESPTCGALSGGSLSQNQTGATFRTRRQDVDVCLVELDDFPDPAFGVYYTGWDRSGDAPQGSVGIHHPNTDEKAISFNDDPLTTQGSCITSGTVDTHWWVDNWEDGTTEPGSSGSGLWDPDSKLLVGFLSGGLASCTVIDYDCYGKFSVAWDGSSSSTRLRDWLDPSGTGVLQVQGSYPSGDGVLVYSSFTSTDDCQGVSDGVLEPGESASISLRVRAVIGDVTGITGTLSSTTPGVTIVQDTVAWPDILANTDAESSSPFVVQTDPGLACFSEVQFSATLSDGLGNEFVMPFTIAVGLVQGPSGLPVSIPDNNVNGITSSFDVAEDVTLTDLDVRVNIEHTWVGDLRIQLRSPAGTVVTLLDRPGVPGSSFGCSDDDLDVTFDDDGTLDLETYCAGSAPWYSGVASPAQPLSAFIGQSSLGTWSLIVSDNAGSDVGRILEWELITTPSIASGTCEPCVVEVPGQLFASTMATSRVSIVLFPDGSGDRLDNAQAWDGVPNSSPTRVNATVIVRVESSQGTPIGGIPAAELVLGSTEGRLVLCGDSGAADSDTDAFGETSFSGSIAGGGVSNVGLDERLTVNGLGLVTTYASPPGMEITFNSPDFNGDLVVDLGDVGDFSQIYGMEYDYAADFAWDGKVNLGDVGVLSEALGRTCANANARKPPLLAASGDLQLAFDKEGTRSRANLRPGETVDAYLVLRGDVARAGILGWEATLRVSSNVRVLSTEVLGGALNVLGDGAFVVGAPAGGLRAEGGSLALARVQLAVTDTAPAHLYLDASPIASGGAEGPVLLVAAGETKALRALPLHDAPLASLNDGTGDAPASPVGVDFALTNNPNPFNPSTELQFALPRDGRVEIRVFDVSGRLVKHFDLGEITAGVHTTVWRGEDQNGREIVSGVYFSRLYVDGAAVGGTRKLSLLK
jgi:subtilisin-like proprotein convertase family protein